MAINKSDVMGAITVYLLNENRPCPAHYLNQKFGDDVADVVASLKKDGVIIGRRGRNGGIVFPDTVFTKKPADNKTQPIEVKPVEIHTEIVKSDYLDIEPDIQESDYLDVQIEDAPF
jgi:predicted metal-dependent RNase